MNDYIQYLRSFVGNNKVIMVASGVFIIDSEERVLLQFRSDNHKWGHPGGFMELGEKVEDTARREAFEETGLKLGKMEFLGIYSGSEQERTLANGDEIALVKIMFICRDFEGELNINNEETLHLKFFPIDSLPEIWETQKAEFIDLVSVQASPFIR